MYHEMYSFAGYSNDHRNLYKRLQIMPVDVLLHGHRCSTLIVAMHVLLLLLFLPGGTQHVQELILDENLLPKIYNKE